MKVIILLILGIGLLPTVSAASHSIRYVYTATSGIPDFPEFVNLGILDGMQIDYYDSNTKKVVPKQDWMAKAVGSDYWDRETQNSIGREKSFKANIDTAKQRFNQTGGVHVAQMMFGCEWDDETGVTRGFNQQGFDGEDFISFDLKTLTWIAPKPQAVITKNKWDNNKAGNEYWKNYLTQECIDWVKKYVDYEKSSLMRTVPPSVSLLQKTPSSPVTCHATGFYPSGVHVTWKKDGQEQHEDVEVGETLQNDDGTFQTSVRLNVKPEEWKNNKYQCVVQISGTKKDFIKVLTEDELLSNWGKTNRGVNDQTSIGPIIGVVVAGLLVIVAAVIIGVVIWKKNRKGFVPANTSDGGSSTNSAPEA
ncbi:major histocompatibility complex class I-related gene protein-like isoform X2 [Esox lucius]|uniref:major histocompatibility complex class I-related gene protein-like isoform X2 n=1 Tax=Esox lucius TaxID=8010 RepID=UPI00147735C7|nr:major histocompatibility complex class I-related gene protein-like isoform X2 [Esox lucius]